MYRLHLPLKGRHFRRAVRTSPLDTVGNEADVLWIRRATGEEPAPSGYDAVVRTDAGTLFAREMTPARHPIVDFKLDLLRRAARGQTAVVFGDMYLVDGFYSRSLLDMGFSRAVLIDLVETARFVERRLAAPGLDFYKGDFSDPLFMASVREHFDMGVAFDVLLHQANLLQTLHHMTDKVDRLCIVQPMVEERAEPGTVVYLPGSGAAHLLDPFGPDVPVPHPADAVDAGHWIWATTPSFLRHALAGEGFHVWHEARFDPLPNPRWFWWGCVADRGAAPAVHWSRTPRCGGLFPAPWPAQQ